MRKLALMIETVYNGLNLVFSWFSLANFYIFFVSYRIHRFLTFTGDPHQCFGGQRFQHSPHQHSESIDAVWLRRRDCGLFHLLHGESSSRVISVVLTIH